MKLTPIALLLINFGNCFRVYDNPNNANEIVRTAAPEKQGNREVTILDRFYDYVEDARRAKEIEEEAKLLDEETAKTRGGEPRQEIEKMPKKTEQRSRIWQRRKLTAMKKERDSLQLPDPMIDQVRSRLVPDYTMIPLRVYRRKRQAPEILDENSEAAIAENSTSNPLEDNEEYLGAPSQAHISEIKEELNKLQDLVAILRDQQYILTLLNRVGDEDSPKNATELQQSHKQNAQIQEADSTNEEEQIQDFNSNWNQNPYILNMKRDIDQLKSLVSDILKKRNQNKLASELDQQKKEIDSLKKMLLNLSKSTPNDKAMGLREAEESDEKTHLQHMLKKIYDVEGKLNTIMSQNSPPDEVLGSTAGAPLPHQPSFRKNKTYVVPKHFTKITRTSEAQSRASDSDDEIRSILSALNSNSHPTGHKRELIRIQKELASLRKLAQNDEPDDLDGLLKSLGLGGEQRDDSFELNSDSDIADKILDLQKTPTKKADVHKTLRDLERQIKSLNNKTRLIRLLKKMSPQGKALDASEESAEDVSAQLKNLKDAIDSLQPKEDEEEEGKENGNFELTLQKLISKAKPSPKSPKSALNKSQIKSLTKKLAAMLNKNQFASDASDPDDEPEPDRFDLNNCRYCPYNQDQPINGNEYGQQGIANYGLGNVYGKRRPNFGNELRDLLTYGYNFPQNFKPYPNRYQQVNKVGFYGQVPAINAEQDLVYDSDASYYPPQHYKQGSNNLFLDLKAIGQKPGRVKPHAEAQKSGQNAYGTGAQKYQQNPQQNYDGAYPQQRIGDLRKQIYNLQGVINTLNRPDYLQKPEDKATAYKLDKQITDLKSVVNYLGQNTRSYQIPDHQNGDQKSYSPNRNYQAQDGDVKQLASNYSPKIPNENSIEVIAPSEAINEINYQIYPNVPSEVPPVFTTSFNNGVNPYAVPNPSNLDAPSSHPADGYDQASDSRYERSAAAKDFNSTGESAPNPENFENELISLIDDITAKIERETTSDKKIPRNFASRMETYLLEKLENFPESDKMLCSLADYFLAQTYSRQEKKRTKRSEENPLEELIEAELGDEDSANQSRQNLAELSSALDQLKTQLDSASSDARSSDQLRRQPYQEPNYYQSFAAAKGFSKSSKKSSKKLDVFGKIIDKILDKVVDKAPVVVLKLFNRFFGAGNLDYSGGYGGGNSNLQSLQNFGLSGLIPMAILKVVSNLSYFVSQLQRSRFVKTFLMPGLVLLGVSGMIVFLIWWLQPNDDYNGKQYQNAYGYDNNYYANQYSNTGNNQYGNSNKNSGYDRNSYGKGNSYGYEMMPYQNQRNYRNRNYNGHGNTAYHYRNNYNQDYYKNSLNK